MPGQSGTTYTYSCPLTEKKKRKFSNIPNFEKNLVKKATLKLGEFGLVGKKRTLAFQKMSGLLFAILHQEKVVSCFENLVAQNGAFTYKVKPLRG